MMSWPYAIFAGELLFLFSLAAALTVLALNAFRNGKRSGWRFSLKKLMLFIAFLCALLAMSAARNSP
jgi:hypothetical protein